MTTLVKLFFQPKDKKTNLFYFISQKSKEQIETLGQLFGFIEFASPPNVRQGSTKQFAQKITNLIISLIEENYYQSSLVIQNIETLFEDALQKTNQRIQLELYENFLNKEKIPKNWAEKLNFIIGLIKERQIFFSQLGTSQAFLIRQPKIINILEKLPKQERINPLKIFSHLISGQLKNNDVLLFCTENLLDYFSLEKLRKTFLSQSLENSVQYLERLLAENINILSLRTPSVAAIVLKAALPQKPIFETKKDSMKDLVEKETKTKRLLYPVLGTDIIKKMFNPVFQLFKKIDQRVLATLKEVKLQIFKLGISKIISFGKKFSLQRILNQAPKRFKELSRQSKIFLISSLVLGSLFLQAMAFLVKKQEKEMIKRNYQEKITQIENLWKASEAALIYKNEKEAKKLLERIEEIINQLPQKTLTEQKKVKDLKEKNRNKLNELWRLTLIEEPVLTYDFSHLEKILEIRGIIYLGPELFAWGSQKKEPYEFKKTSEVLFVPSEAMPEAEAVKFINILNENSLLLYHEKMKLTKFDLTKNKLLPLRFSFKELGKSPKDMAFYHRWLYFFDLERNQIFKYTETENGFGQEQIWLKKFKTDISNTISMAIDGAIWLLQSQGPKWVIKLYRGAEKDFNLENPFPPLEKPTKIYTNPNLTSLYILDPPSKRIVVFSKNGQLQKQYFSEKFDALSDFVINKAGRKIYLLNGMKVFEISE